ncbi:MAG: protoporphyrinogen oxidase [Myxococcota bacterium]|jgi:protoporphyrinogen oxidase
MGRVSDLRSVVIGGGAAGLFTAHRLLSRGVRVTVCEAGPVSGGLLGYLQVGDTWIERFYHHFFRTDTFLLNTLAYLGIEAESRITKTGFVGPGSTPIREFSAPQHLLTYPGMSALDRISLLAVLARVSASWFRWGGDVAPLDDVTIEQWMSQFGGARAYKAFFEPLVRKKFGADTPRISAAWMVGRLGMRAGRTHEGEKLFYPAGSYHNLITRLEADIVRRGGAIRTGEAVTGLQHTAGRISGVTTASGEQLPADLVVSTISPRHQAALMRTGGFEGPARAMDKIPYQGAIVVLLGLERSLSDFYWINVMDPDAPFGAIIEHTRFRPVEDFGGPTVYLAAYPDPGDPLWDATDEEIVAHFQEHLSRVMPESMKGNGLRWSEVSRTRLAGLLYHAGLKRLLPEWKSEIPGLWITGMLRCYPKRPIDLIGAEACACADLAVAELRGEKAPRWTERVLPTSLLPRPA